MTNTFNDGDPIDAATLQKLLTRLSQVEAIAGAKVSAGSSINVVPQTAAEIVVPKFFGGVTDQIVLTPGKFSAFTIEYNLGSKPKAIVFGQLYTGKNEALTYMPQVVSLTSTSANCRVRCPGGTPAQGGTTRFYFVAVQN
jgi:hypothetical protein